MSTQTDWRAFVPTAADYEVRAVLIEVRRRYAQGQRIPEIAVAFGMTDADVEALLFGAEGPA